MGEEEGGQMMIIMRRRNNRERGGVENGNIYIDNKTNLANQNNAKTKLERYNLWTCYVRINFSLLF